MVPLLACCWDWLLAAWRHTDDGHESLRARTKPLLQLSQRVAPLPLTMAATSNNQRSYQTAATMQIDGSLSSQYITALLIAAPGYNSESVQTIEITGELVSKPYIDITLNEMRKRGVQAEWIDERRPQVPPQTTSESKRRRDATAATYFCCISDPHGSRITLTNLGRDSQREIMVSWTSWKNSRVVGQLRLELPPRTAERSPKYRHANDARCC